VQYLGLVYWQPRLLQMRGRTVLQKRERRRRSVHDGIRKFGVMSGEAFDCSSATGQPKVGEAVIDLATQASLHFGLQTAFVYSGLFGYGIGHDFDHKTCPQALEDFKDLQAKYLGH
jgi:hypothetical protein